ncbi:hypothetical protein ACOBQJ_10575 [Pelotomaculum propionicicum]|uniref:hypothetical protein n=1 Tax=Pelotomaculum propionicicum TaxID=258475 RepID=UPI003B7689C6
MRQKTVGSIVFIVSLALFFFISNSLALWYVFHQMGFDSSFRFEDGSHVKSDVLDLYVEYVAGQGGYKIAVIGDSVVQGAGVAEREQTITAHLQDELRGSYLKSARVFNFGLPGGRPADLYMTVKKLHEAGAAQMVVVNISYPFFSAEMTKTPLLYFKVWSPGLSEDEKKELKVPANIASAQASQTVSAGTGGSQDIENNMQKTISRYWAVYRFRQELNRYLFGGQPTVRGKVYLDLALNGITPAAAQPPGEPQPEEPLSEKDKPENKYKVWYSFPWSAQDRDHLKNVFNISEKDNVNFKYYRELCRYLAENDIPAVIFMSPVNHGLLQQYSLLDYDAFRINTGVIEKVAAGSGIMFLNYQEAVSPDLFHDSMHMLDGGNALTAGLLSRDLRPLIEGAGVR